MSDELKVCSPVPLMSSEETHHWIGAPILVHFLISDPFSVNLFDYFPLLATIVNHQAVVFLFANRNESKTHPAVQRVNYTKNACPRAECGRYKSRLILLDVRWASTKLFCIILFGIDCKARDLEGLDFSHSTHLTKLWGNEPFSYFTIPQYFQDHNNCFFRPKRGRAWPWYK